jgi:predicted membrane protein
MKKIVIGVIVIMGILLGITAPHMFKDIREEKQFKIDEFNEIQVSMTSEPVRIIEREVTKEVEFHLYGKSMQEIKLATEINNKTLIVSAKRQHKFPVPENMFLEIYLPKEYGKNLSVKILSGAVKMDSFALANFTLNTSSGKLEAEQLKADKISINTSSGGIDIKKIDAKKLEVKALSAVTNIYECIAKEARMETSSGNITLKNSIGNFDIKGKSGKVSLDYKEFQDQSINIETLSGSLTVNVPSAAEFFLEANTATGKIQSDFSFNTNVNNDKRKIQGQIGNSRNKVLLQTLSGSIKILKK